MTRSHSSQESCPEPAPARRGPAKTNLKVDDECAVSHSVLRHAICDGEGARRLRVVVAFIRSIADFALTSDIPVEEYGPAGPDGMTIYAAEPGSPTEHALALLASWTATQDVDIPRESHQ